MTLLRSLRLMSSPWAAGWSAVSRLPASWAVSQSWAVLDPEPPHLPDPALLCCLQQECGRGLPCQATSGFPSPSAAQRGAAPLFRPQGTVEEPFFTLTASCPSPRSRPALKEHRCNVSLKPSSDFTAFISFALHIVPGALVSFHGQHLSLPFCWKHTHWLLPPNPCVSAPDWWLF